MGAERGDEIVLTRRVIPPPPPPPFSRWSTRPRKKRPSLWLPLCRKRPRQVGSGEGGKRARGDDFDCACVSPLFVPPPPPRLSFQAPKVHVEKVHPVKAAPVVVAPVAPVVAPVAAKPAKAEHVKADKGH